MLENKLYYNKLFDCYGNLFTDAQREYFISYFHDDLSLSEISENLNVSRAGISKQLKVIKETLDNYEEKLGNLKMYEEIDYICANIDSLNKEDIIKLLIKFGGEV